MCYRNALHLHLIRYTRQQLDAATDWILAAAPGARSVVGKAASWQGMEPAPAAAPATVRAAAAAVRAATADPAAFQAAMAPAPACGTDVY